MFTSTLKMTIAILLLSVLFSGCGSHPVLPKKSDIKVTRNTPGPECKSLGSIEGRSIKTKPTQDDVLDDLKEEAIRKGANVVKAQTMGSLGGTIRGEAFFCE